MPSSIPSAASTAPARPCTSPRCCATARASPRSTCRSRSWSSGPDGVEYRRTVVPDQGVGGRALERADGVVGADRHLARARLHRSEAAAGRRDHLHGRRLCAGPARIRARLERQGRSPRPRRPRSPSTAAILYGAPAAKLELEGEMVDRAGERAARALPATSSASPTRRSRRRAPAARRPARDRRATARRRFAVDARQAAGDDAAARGARSSCAWPSPAAARSSASSTLPVTPAGADDRRQAAVLRHARSARARTRASTSSLVAPDGKPLARSGLRYELLKVETPLPVVPPRRPLGLRAGQVDPAHRRRHDRRRRRPAGAHLGAGAAGAATGSKSRPATAAAR